MTEREMTADERDEAVRKWMRDKGIVFDPTSSFEELLDSIWGHGVWDGRAGKPTELQMAVNDRRPVWELLIIKAEDHLGGEHA